MPIAITAKQFEWNVTYPGPDGQLGTADDFTVRNQLHIPVNRPVVVNLEAEDVIHSFFVPAFRVKQDAVPGMQIRGLVPGRRDRAVRDRLRGAVRAGALQMRAVVTVHTAGRLPALAWSSRPQPRLPPR